MNTELILSTNIQNIDTAYGGMRGTTLSSQSKTYISVIV